LRTHVDLQCTNIAVSLGSQIGGNSLQLSLSLWPRRNRQFTIC